MTTLVSVYTTKTNKTAVDKAISILEQADIYVFTTGAIGNDQAPGNIDVLVLSPDQDKAELLLEEVYSMGQIKLPGEFVCYEVRGNDGELKGINIFYEGVLQHTWTMPKEAFVMNEPF